MKNLYILCFIFLHSIAHAQEVASFDEIPPEVSRATELQEINLIFLKIFTHPEQAKGFIIDSSLTECPNADTANVRAMISSLGNQLFLVQYKYRQSADFIQDTCAIYSIENSTYIALPIKHFPDHKPTAEKQFEYLHYIPASTDERDVVYSCRKQNGIILLFE